MRSSTAYDTRYEMKRSLEVFQAEWYEMQQTGKFKDRVHMRASSRVHVSPPLFST